MKYGLPYKGSKNKLAKRILALMPRAEHFIDLFCGGCAVSHCALTMGKYPHVHVNDADWRPVTLFMDVLQGRYADEDRWISREDFARLKDKDPYVAVVWSFGNNMRDYLYSRDIEPLKRAIHYAIFYSDYAPGKELGHDLSFIDCIPSLDRRYIAVKRYFSQFGHFQQQSFFLGGGENQAMQLEYYSRTMRLAYAKPGIGGVLRQLQTTGYSVKRPSELQHLECRNRVDACIKKKNWRSPLLRASAVSQPMGTRTDGCIGSNTGSDTPLCLCMGGGEKRFPHLVGGRLCRCGDTPWKRGVLRHSLPRNQRLRQGKRFQLSAVL